MASVARWFSIDWKPREIVTLPKFPALSAPKSRRAAIVLFSVCFVLAFAPFCCFVLAFAPFESESVLLNYLLYSDLKVFYWITCFILLKINMDRDPNMWPYRKTNQTMVSLCGNAHWGKEQLVAAEYTRRRFDVLRDIDFRFDETCWSWRFPSLET